MVDDDQFPVFTDSNNSLVDNTSSTLDSGIVEYHIIGFNDNSSSTSDSQVNDEASPNHLIVMNNDVPSCVMLIGQESGPSLNEVQMAVLRRHSGINEQSTCPAPKPRRKYRKYTQHDMEFVKNLHRRYPNRKEAFRIGVELSNFSRQYLNYLLRKLENGQSIKISSVRRGRRRVFLDDHLRSMVDFIRENPIITDGRCASMISDKYGIPMSRSSVQRIRTDYDRMKEVGATAITFKISSRRGVNAQSPENKQRRIDVANTIKSLPSKYRIVFIDEAHWEICRKFGYAKSPVGTKAIVNNEGKGISNIRNSLYVC